MGVFSCLLGDSGKYNINKSKPFDAPNVHQPSPQPSPRAPRKTPHPNPSINRPIPPPSPPPSPVQVHGTKLKNPGGVKFQDELPTPSNGKLVEVDPTKSHIVDAGLQVGKQRRSSSVATTGSGHITDESEPEYDDFSKNVEIEEERRPGIVPLPTNPEETTIDDTIKKHPKTPEYDALIRGAIARNEFLNKILQGTLLDSVVDAMYERAVQTDEFLTNEGTQGSHMYVSVEGRYEISIKGAIVNVFDDARVFGELAILYNCKRNATIKAVQPGKVFVLERGIYQKLMIRDNILEQDERVRFLMNVPKLNAVGETILGKVSQLLKSQFYPTGSVIIKQGDVGDKFYIIKAGSVTISQENVGVVDKRKDGQYFGELALLGSDKRAATVIADSPGCELLSLERADFIAHFGELQDIKSVGAAAVKRVSDAADEHGYIKLQDLVTLKTLGVGGFGRVDLVTYGKTSEKFALKYLKKIDMVEQNQQEHVKNERNIQRACRSKFIVRLYRSYKDDKYIYFLMEPCMGGDLWTLLQRQRLRRFKEKDARFIAACVLESFAYLHERGIVYRDLKPENLMIDKKGYIKLTDFGFAKELGARGRTYTFAGTPEYVAPEIILNKGHDKGVDYWAYGVFIFELLTGSTPFKSNDPSHMGTYNKILNGIDYVKFPDELIPHKARHVIEKLCRPKSSDRLGCQKNGVKDVKSARWFLGFEWDKLEEGKLTAPFKPKLDSDTDTKYFQKFKPDNDIPQAETSGWDKDF